MNRRSQKEEEVEKRRLLSLPENRVSQPTTMASIFRGRLFETGLA